MNRLYLSIVVSAGLFLCTTAKVTFEIRSTANERMDRYRILLLKYFATPRHPLINEKKWLSTRTGIAKELEKILFNVPNVTVEKQNFETEILYRQPEATGLIGQNIIVTFHGRNQGTKNDEILLIGAHYDSDSSRLVAMNDNGSGVVAILECIHSLSDQIINKRTILMNTVIFVLFDVQRSQNELVRDLEQATGSMYYIKEKLSPILNAEPKPIFLGAIILDSVMNYNCNKNSQILHDGFNKSFPVAFQKITANNNTGNFLNMVVDERLNNLHLHHIFNQQWKETDFKDRYPLIQLVIKSEAASPALFEFLLQDHTPFWHYVKNGSSFPLPAILLTDTGKWREMGMDCGSKLCKAENFITSERLEMLDQLVLTIGRLISISLRPGVTINAGSSLAFKTPVSFLAFVSIGFLHLITSV